MSDDLRRVQLLIDGAWGPAGTGRTITTTAGSTGAPIAEVAAAGLDDVDRAVTAAAAAADEWASTSPGRRRDLLEKAARILSERSEDITALMSREMGAAAGWCHFNVHVAVGMLREAAAQTYSTVGEVIPSDVPGLTALGVRQPAGVTVGIAPWNAPLILGVRAVAMPLAYGNTVVLKASEQTPGTQAEIARALADAGLPAGAVNLITNDAADAPSVVERLIAHPLVRRINFTGSTKVGRTIGELAGRHLKRVVLELGGKAPLLVLRDASVDDAVDAAVFGAFMNQGQICMSTERLVVAGEVIDEFSRKLAERAASLTVGDAADPKTEIGPMVHEQACAHVESLIEDAVAHGAEVLTGGGRDGLFFQPTVLRGVTPQMRIYQEESFGPVASIIEADSEDRAVEIANDTRYGLSSAIFSTDVGHALDLAKRIRAGICHINGATVHDEPQMPFGGVGDSGFGRFGSRAALEEFTELRWITIQSGGRHYPI
ncbi:aldehyde dehydrogenase [Actinomadura fibrosa]|uniref:Aldehyde dehydrogenase n=1 Tax=Actinomadura fibrosa TaxID=111802 RepID=A0ABW2Y1G1_9ACTN|nr:aldehyde dehydrogenase [Actinomadura fibrosa]